MNYMLFYAVVNSYVDPYLSYHTLFEGKTVVYSQKIQNELKYIQRANNLIEFGRKCKSMNLRMCEDKKKIEKKEVKFGQEHEITKCDRIEGSDCRL